MQDQFRVDIALKVQGSPVATIGNVSFPVEAYAVEKADQDGRALVTLVVAVDNVSVGRSPATVTSPADKPQEQVSYWGDPTQPDPRAAIYARFGQQPEPEAAR